MNSTVNSLENQLNVTKTQLTLKINENYIQTQGQISQLTSSLTSTQESINEKFDELKASISSDFSGIIETAVNSVVSVKTDVSQGSGFFITNDGYIVTNAHILDQAHLIKIVTYSQGQKDATLIGYDDNLDIALLKVSGNFDALTLANSDNIKVGEKVIAVGNPYGLSFTVTEGIVSAVNREANGLQAYIQTDVPLNPGNSGGPLIDKQGEVIGINNFKVSGGEALGFALESNYVEEAINSIAEKALNQQLI